MTERVKTVIGYYFLLPDFQFRGHPTPGPRTLLLLIKAQNSRFTFEPDSLDSDSSCPESSISFSVNNQSAVPVILPTCGHPNHHSIPPGHFPETPPDTTPENSPRESIEPLPPSPIETRTSIDSPDIIRTALPTSSDKTKSSRNTNS